MFSVVDLMVHSLLKIANVAAITTSLNALILRRMGGKEDLTKNRSGFTFRERLIARTHLGTVKGLQLTSVRHRTRHHAVGPRHFAEVTCEHSRICNAMVWHSVVLVRAVDVDGLHKIVHVVRLVDVFLVQSSQLGLGQLFFQVVI